MTNEDDTESQSLEGSLPPFRAPLTWTIVQATSFIARVAARFHNNPSQYVLFLKTLADYFYAQMKLLEAYSCGTALPKDFKMPTIHEIYASVSTILKDEPDLLEECSKYIQPQTADPHTADPK